MIHCFVATESVRSIHYPIASRDPPPPPRQACLQLPQASEAACAHCQALRAEWACLLHTEPHPGRRCRDRRVKQPVIIQSSRCRSCPEDATGSLGSPAPTRAQRERDCSPPANTGTYLPPPTPPPSLHRQASPHRPRPLLIAQPPTRVPGRLLGCSRAAPVHTHTPAEAALRATQAASLPRARRDTGGA